MSVAHIFQGDYSGGKVWNLHKSTPKPAYDAF